MLKNVIVGVFVIGQIMGLARCAGASIGKARAEQGGLVCQTPVNGVAQCTLGNRKLQCVVSPDGKTTSCFPVGGK